VSIHTSFAASAGQHPDCVALECDGVRLTYAELLALVDPAAESLANRAGSRVGLWATRTVATYVGYLAVQRAGRSVVPLNPDYPAERTLRMLEQAGAGLVLGDDVPSWVTSAGVEARPVPVATPTTTAVGTATTTGSSGEVDPEAYLLFTSGSTGTPKGIPIRSSNLADFVPYNVARYDVGPGARLSQTFGLTFDPSVFDMAVAWHAGATLVVPSRAQLLDPVAFVREAGITHWYSVPSLITAAQLAGALEPDSMPDLRWSLFAGEQLPRSLAAAWHAAAPLSTIENLYGPTELTVTVTHYRLPEDPDAWPVTSNGTVPIGSVYPHLEGRVDADTGELLVRGSQRFHGYLDRAHDAGRFEPDVTTGPPTPDRWYHTGDKVATESGALVHLGRLDRQVKLAGQRVELGDIEAALRSAGGVDDAVVVAGPDQLVAICLGEEREPRDLRARLRTAVPPHMVPRRFVWLDRFPLTANGKVDHAACLKLSL
jgi:amino acid adenylation domain-containing protein